MPVVTNVFLRGGLYYFRVRVPKHLVAKAGRAELWRSLRTSQAHEARRRGLTLHILTETLWRDLERAMDHSQSKALIDAWLRAEIGEDAYLRSRPEGERFVAVVMRREPPWTPDRVVRELDHDALAAHLSLTPDEQQAALGPDGYLLREVSERELALAGQKKVFGNAATRLGDEDEEVAIAHVRQVFERHGIPVDVFSQRFEVATKVMMRAHADLASVIAARDGGWREHLDDDPAEPVLAKLGAEAPTSVALSPLSPQEVQADGEAFPVSQAASMAVAEIARVENFKPKRTEDYRNAVSTFLDFLKNDPDLSAVTPRMAGDFATALTHLPSNAHKRVPYRDLSTFEERVRASEAAGEKAVLSATTIKGKYLGPLKRIFDWCREKGRASQNPFDGITVRGSRRIDPRKKRRDFTNSEVSRLFELPLFTGSQGPAHDPLYKPGTYRVRDWRYWVPLICLFSGMRLNEACGLALADIKSADGVSYFHVRDELDEQSLKWESSRRKVPIHASLLDLGLLEFVEELRANGHVRLFDELEPDASGYLSGRPSKFLTGLAKRIVDADADDPGNLVFHSSRHTVISRLRAANVREDVAKEIVGHEQGDVHGGYGRFDMPTLKAAVDKIAYPGVDLTRVRLPTKS